MTDNPYAYTSTPQENRSDKIDQPAEISRINFVTNDGFEGEQEKPGSDNMTKKPKVLFHNVDSKFVV